MLLIMAHNFCFVIAVVFGCPAALYSLMSPLVGVGGGPKIYQLYMPSYQNKSCSVCLQDVYLTFFDSGQ